MLLQLPGGLGELDGQAGLLDGAKGRMRYFQEHFAVLHLWVVENVLQVVDGTRGDADGLQVGNPVVGVLGLEVFHQE